MTRETPSLVTTQQRFICRRGHLFPSLVMAFVVAGAGTARAQAPANAAPQTPSDTPSIRVGATFFADYTFTRKPEQIDAQGNRISPNAFNVTRSYINVSGTLSHIVSFRLTPDVVRDVNAANGTSGSLVFRIKYAYAQFNLDDWLLKGSWVRLGIQPTPLIDSVEAIYRYRFQGTTLPERATTPWGTGYLSSADAGVSFRTPFAGDYGDFQAAIFNGESYTKPEANDQKAAQVRVGVRPLPSHPVLRGLRVQGFYDADRYSAHAARNRRIFNVTFEHRAGNVGFDYLVSKDRLTPNDSDVRGSSWSLWAAPKIARGFEALLRYDHEHPDRDTPGFRRRTIIGLAYWFPVQRGLSSALLFDVENVDFKRFEPLEPTQQRLFLHCLVSF